MSARTLPLLLLVPLTTAALGGSYAEEKSPCPTPLNGGEHRADPLHFAYKSWAWPEKKDDPTSSLVCCTCVRNLGSAPLFVKWEEKSLWGFVPPTGTIYTYETSADTASETRPVTLWYGPHPDSIRVDTSFPKPPSAPAPPRQPAPVVSSLHSQGVLYVPDLLRIQRMGQNPKEAFTLVAKDPGLLADVTMEFESRVERDEAGNARGILHRCTYGASLGSPSPMSPYLSRMAFKDSTLQRIMFDHTDAVPLMGWAGNFQTAEGHVAFTPGAAHRVKVAHTSFVIVNGSLPKDSPEYIMASIPITYLVATSQESAKEGGLATGADAK